MRVPLGWLNELVEVDVPVQKLAHRLDMSGTKVEAVHRPGASVGGVVVAEVLAITDHPNADNLTLVDVRIEGDETERVVCGVRNFRVGDRVPLATVGARLPDLEVGERKIRGEVSRGMLCSAAELGISRDHSGILVLPPDAPLGEDVVRVLELDDTVLELEITPNRPDCMGMLGVAREVAALLRNELRIPEAVVDEMPGTPVTVDISDPEGCPRYLARYLQEISVAPSPAKIAARLLAAGTRPISNVVDATNYVLLETGHPLHAFDAAAVHAHAILVRRAKKGETLVTLDGIARTLDPDDVLIADRKGPLALAGVMGGASSEVSGETNDVILESAYFDPGSIARTSRRQLLRTDASARFERGTDPEVVPYAAARCAALIASLTGGSVGAAVDVYPATIERRHIHLRPAQADALLGFSVSASEQAQHLRSLGLVVTDEDGELDVEVPGFRPDLERPVDLIEEIARLAGFDRLRSTLPPGRAGGLDPDQTAERRLRRALVAAGLQEAWTISFFSSKDLDALGLPDDHPGRALVRLANPMSEDQDALRTSLLPGLLRSCARNLAERAETVALWELSRVYEPSDEELPQEALVLAAVMTGSRHPRAWRGDAGDWDFFSAKGALEAALSSLSAGALTYSPVHGMPFHPTRAASVSREGTVLGIIGELHPDVCERFEVARGTVAFEVAAAPLLARSHERATIGELPRFPPLVIDLAVVVTDEVSSEQVRSVIEGAARPELSSLRLFDVYRGEQVAEGHKSLAFRLELRAPNKTLTDDDALVVRQRILTALSERTGAELRGS